MDYALIEYINIPQSNCKGVRMSDMSNVTVSHIFYSTVGNSGAQTDGIAWDRCDNLVIEHNEIHILNNGAGHNDAIQKYDEPTGVYDFTIRYNKIYLNTRDASDTQGIFLEDASGRIEIYNNLVVSGDTNKAHINFKTIQSACDAYIYNNTIIAGSQVPSGGNLVRFDVEASGSVIRFQNNIVVCTSTGHNLILMNGSPTVLIDYNLWYSPNDDGVWNGSSWSSWRSSGNDPNGLNQNPSLDGTYRPDSENDPSVDNGILLSLFSDDLDGISRPQGNGWDIGCYEFGSRGGDITPPEVTGATLLDSVTLKILFSEMLDQSTAEDENNYSITNNINIFNASLSGSEVTLQTSVHSPGSYIVTVINVEDLAGNPISNSNTAEYSLIPADSVVMYPIEEVIGIVQEPDHTPSKTIDGMGALNGDPDSRWAAEPMPKDLVFDLGTIKSVSKTRLSFYRWDAGRVYTYSILVSNNNIDWQTVISPKSSSSSEWTIDDFNAIQARYIKVYFIDNNESGWAGLWEGQIWGNSVTAIDPLNNGVPRDYSLEQNYPNPFNPSTKIRFNLTEKSNVILKVFNSLGQEVAELINTNLERGVQEVDFNASGLASGVYFYRIVAGNFIDTKKMILLR